MHLKLNPEQVRTPAQPGQLANYPPLSQPEDTTFMKMPTQLVIGLFPMIVGIVLCAVMLLPLLNYQQPIVGTWTLVNTWTLVGGQSSSYPDLCIREFGVGSQLEFKTDGSAVSDGTELEYSILDSQHIELSPYGGHVYNFSLSGNTLEFMNTGDYKSCIYQRSSR